MRQSLAQLRLTSDRRNVHWWHKWTGILGGIALVGWIITGAVMIPSPALVDASSGAVITETPELASRIAQALELPGATLAGVERLERHTLGYSEGPLPVYEVSFRDPAGVVTYVAARAGYARRTTRGTRIARMFASVHLFSPLNHAPGGNDTRAASLWIASLVAFISLLTGYWLLLPQRRKR